MLDACAKMLYYTGCFQDAGGAPVLGKNKKTIEPEKDF